MRFLPVLLFLSHFTTHAQDVLTTDASLSSVTLFNSGVEMHHKARIALPQGSSELVIGNMANAIVENTIQVGSNANVTIMSVSFNKNHLKPLLKGPEYKTVEDSLKRINKLLGRLTDEKAIEEAVLRLMEKNSVVAGVNTGLNVAELARLTTLYKSKQTESKNNLAAIADREEVLQEKRERLLAQLSELSADKSGTTGQIILQVMANNAASTDFNISYVSPSAGWSAFYDLRADNTTDPIKLAYKANIMQQTGLNWEKIKLTLSSGNPASGATAPTLSTWFLRFGSKQLYLNELSPRRPVSEIVATLEGQAPGVSTTSGGGQPGSLEDVQVRGFGSLNAGDAPMIVVDGVPYSGSLASIDPSTIESVSSFKDATAQYGARGSGNAILITTKNKTAGNYTTQQENNLNVTFDIDVPYTIASNGKPHSVSLQDVRVPARFTYLAIPKLDPDAFLMAEVTDYDKLNLLPGFASIIFENMYVGKSYINPGITGDTLNLGMGRDRKITIKREKVGELSGTKAFGNNIKQTYTYEIRIRNGKKEAVDLMLKDQFPIATDKDMDIELLQSDGAEIDKETGMLTWKLDIAPGQTRQVKISYSVKYPANKPIANL